jgi:hypothetical protein
LGVGILVGLGGIAWATAGDGAIPRDAVDSPVEYPSTEVTSYAVNAPSDAVAVTIAGLDSTRFVSARVGESPQSQRPGRWFYAVLATQKNANERLVSSWEADLAQGAIAELVGNDESNLGDVIVGSSVSFSNADGSLSEAEGGAGDIAAGQRFPAQTEVVSDATIRSEISRAASKFGLAVSNIQILHPLGPAPRVELTAPNATALTGRYPEIRAALFGATPRFEGFFLAISLPDGSTVVRGSAAFRAGSGRLWVNPKYDSLIGADHG